MSPLGTYDLVINFLVLVMMPLIIWANLRNSGIKSALHAYLWREHPNLMRVSLMIIALLVLHAASALMGHFGLIPAAAVEATDVVIGVSLLPAAVVVIWLAVGAALKALRKRGSGSKGA